MWAYVSMFSAPKRGSKPSECEDAAWIGPSGDRIGDVAERSIRMAVADGATESLLAGKWARLLTTTFGTSTAGVRSPTGFLSTYRTATNDWTTEVERYVSDREERGLPIQWFEEPGLARGAFSTLIVFEVMKAVEGRRSWRAAALGDSCVFQVHADQIYRSFPITKADDFSNRPSLLPSRPVDDNLVLRHLKTCRGVWAPGDSFYLTTDALAAWFLRTNDDGERPWEPLRDLGTVDFDLDFPDWVNLKRDQGELKDDDTTLIRLDLY